MIYLMKQKSDLSLIRSLNDYSFYFSKRPKQGRFSSANDHLLFLPIGFSKRNLFAYLTGYEKSNGRSYYSLKIKDLDRNEILFEKNFKRGYSAKQQFLIKKAKQILKIIRKYKISPMGTLSYGKLPNNFEDFEYSYKVKHDPMQTIYLYLKNSYTQKSKIFEIIVSDEVIFDKVQAVFFNDILKKGILLITYYEKNEKEYDRKVEVYKLPVLKVNPKDIPH